LLVKEVIQFFQLLHHQVEVVVDLIHNLLIILLQQEEAQVRVVEEVLVHHLLGKHLAAQEITHLLVHLKEILVVVHQEEVEEK